MDLYTPPSVAYGGAYSIRPYDRIRAILRNTDTIYRPEGGGVWEVGRWGLPLAGEVGVNEFGEEEDDDQNNDNKGA